MKRNGYRITYVMGILGSILISAGAVITALAYVGREGEAYSPLNHWVSELGQVSVSETATIFNLSLIMGGFCLAIFLIGLASRLKGWFRYLFGVIGLVAGVSGMLVGVFPMDDLAVHRQVAQTFFNSGWIAVSLFSLYVLFAKQSIFPRWFIIPGVVTVTIFIAFLTSLNGLTEEMLSAPTNRLPLWNATIYEWLVIGSVLIWACLVSLYLRHIEKKLPPTS